MLACVFGRGKVGSGSAGVRTCLHRLDTLRLSSGSLGEWCAWAQVVREEAAM
jgi:hypothetical protein